MSSAREGSGGSAGEAARGSSEATAAPAIDLAALATVDHDLRTLLGGVVRLADRLLNTSLDAEQQDLARRIRGNGAALMTLVEDVRAMGELAPGAPPITRVDFDLRRAVEEAGDALAADAAQRGVELVVVIPPEVPGGVRGDAVRFRQLLNRLGKFAIGSAAGAGDAVGGEVVLRVELVGESAGGVVVRIEASYDPGRDTPGDEGERRSGLRFDPFSPGLGGAGLGLVLAKRLVEALGGHLQSTTDPAGGGLLWFELPFERRGRSTTRGLVPRIDLSGKRALIIDDSIAAQCAIRAMVELLAMECDVSRTEPDAKRALRAAAAHGAPYDLALIDAALPAGAASRLRAEAVALGAKVVLLAYPSQAALIGDAQALPKPVRAAQLHTTLRGLLQPSSEEFAAPQRPSRPRPSAPSARPSPSVPPPPPSAAPASPAAARPENPAAPPRRSGAYQAVRIQGEVPPVLRAGASAAVTTRASASPIAPTPPARRDGPDTPPPVSEIDVLAQMRDLLVHRAPALSTRMRIAAVDGRMDDLGALARELHDQASRLALIRLGDLCARLERQARAGTPEAALAAVQAIEEELLRSRRSVSAEGGGRNGPG